MPQISLAQLKKELAAQGYDLLLSHKSPNAPAIELTALELELLKEILKKNLTMTSMAKLVNTVKSCRYVVENNIPGDFVECGVWRGGSCIAAKKVFESLGSNKKAWLFDTFEGMTKPTKEDVHIASGNSVEKKWEQSFNGKHSEWVYSSLDEVKNNLLDFELNLDEIVFVQGDVAATLQDPQNIPEQISVLRLDTDWYESTKIEMEFLYPKISLNGVLIQDDYGHFAGAKKATDEYFSLNPPAPMLQVVDYAGRSAIKVRN